MSFNDLKPIYKEFLLKLAVTLTKDELYQRSKSIMRRQKKKKLRKKNATSNGQVSGRELMPNWDSDLTKAYSTDAPQEVDDWRQESEEGFSFWQVPQSKDCKSGGENLQVVEASAEPTDDRRDVVKKPDKPLGLTSWCPGHNEWFGCFRVEA